MFYKKSCKIVPLLFYICNRYKELKNYNKKNSINSTFNYVALHFILLGEKKIIRSSMNSANFISNNFLIQCTVILSDQLTN